jgi:hypothetical protein
MTEFETLDDNNDVVGLLELIRGLVFSTQVVQYEYWKIQAGFRKLFAQGQLPKESLESYGKRFEAHVDEL